MERPAKARRCLLSISPLPRQLSVATQHIPQTLALKQQ